MGRWICCPARGHSLWGKLQGDFLAADPEKIRSRGLRCYTAESLEKVESCSVYLPVQFWASVFLTIRSFPVLVC
ncbi:unnamed protein product [Urochloa humidicola]